MTASAGYPSTQPPASPAQLAHQRGIRVAAGLVHHVANEEAEQARLASACSAGVGDQP